MIFGIKLVIYQNFVSIKTQQAVRTIINVVQQRAVHTQNVPLDKYITLITKVVIYIRFILNFVPRVLPNS